MMRINLTLFLTVCFCLALPTQGDARDTRLAVIVGNEVGWKGDPKLQYVGSGDLVPLAKTLRNIGFHVKVLHNKDARSIRRMLRWVKRRVRQSPKITTFLFYYTGHADRRHFHLGPKGKRPVSYKEFVEFLQKLPVRRRIALLDACFSGQVIRQFGSITRYRDLVRKGASGTLPLDISKTLPHHGESSGLQVITSSADYAWESKRYRASVFTYHMLRGLKGNADRDKDGMISVDELFNFVRDAMVKDIRQKPQMFGVVRRSRPYALAPAYHSQLRIGADVVGTLQVSVQNFVWKQQKKTRQPLQLSLVHGWGTVELKKQGKGCWKQRIYLPKGGKAQLKGAWTRVPCERVSYTRKGSVVMPLQLRSIEPSWSVELSTGVWGGAGLMGNTMPMLGGDLGLRWEYFGLFAEFWGNQMSFSSQLRSQMYAGLRLEGGYRGSWSIFRLFAGGFVGAGWLWQDLARPELAGLLFRYGLTLAPGISLSPRWALSLRAQAGFLLGQFGDQLRNEFSAGASLSLAYRW